MSQFNISKDLRDYLLTLGSVSGVPIVYPQHGDDTPDDGIWLELSTFTNEPEHIFLSNDDDTQYTGLFQVVACYRKKNIFITASTLIEEIKDHFKIGTKINGIEVIKQPWVKEPIFNKSYHMLPVRISWRIFE